LSGKRSKKRFKKKVKRFKVFNFLNVESAARLEWKSFFVAGKAKAKRLGTEGGKAAQKI